MLQEILLIDNYDSFTYNLYHLLYTLTGKPPVVVRNDKVAPEFVNDFQALVLSPGPGLPSEAGKMIECIKAAWNKIPVLGVCLGHQAIGELMGAKLKNMQQVFHGVSRSATIVEKGKLYNGIDSPFEAGSYHSWTIDPLFLPEEMIVTAVDDEGEILSFHHKTLPLTGIQYHPESILTPAGPAIIANWLRG